MALVSSECSLCFAPIEYDDSAPTLLLDATRDKVKRPKQLHICSGESPAAPARREVAAGAPSPSAQIAIFLGLRVTALKDLGLAATVPDAEGLALVLARDMKRKGAKAGETRSDDAWLAAARGQIQGNGTTALTTSDDRYTGLVGGEAFDELHELVHILSAPGGESPLHAFKLQVNEGAINYFSEKIAQHLGVAVVTRYPAETQMVKRMVKLIGEGVGKKGPEELYGATFKGKINDFFEAVGEAYVALGDKQPDGKTKGFSDKGYNAATAAAAFKEKAQAWNVTWLAARLPALI